MSQTHFTQRLRSAYQTVINDGLTAACSKGYRNLRRAMESRYAVRQGKLVQRVGGSPLRFVVSDRDDYMMAKINDEDELLVNNIVSELQDGDVFFDIGAAVGVYSLAVASLRPNVTTVSFEPNPHNMQLLRQNVSLNNAEVDLHQMALSDTDGTVSMSGQGVTGIGQISGDQDGEPGMTVATKRGDNFVSEHGLVPTVLKIDVEGAEPQVIEGFQDTLQRSEARTIYCEVHRPASGAKITDFGTTPAEFEAELRHLGFSIEVLRDPHPEWNYFIKATSC